MVVEIARLEQLREAAARGESRFKAQYDGSFLLALGLLEAEEIDRPADAPVHRPLRRLHTLEIALLDPDQQTMTMSFEDRLSHRVEEHPLAGKAFFLPHILGAPPVVFGRDLACDIVVPDPSVSARHCEALLDVQGRLVILDLDSRNGTLVNLERLAPGEARQLADEDLLAFGRYSFQFYSAEALREAVGMLGAG